MAHEEPFGQGESHGQDMLRHGPCKGPDIARYPDMRREKGEREVIGARSQELEEPDMAQAPEFMFSKLPRGVERDQDVGGADCRTPFIFRKVPEEREVCQPTEGFLEKLPLLFSEAMGHQDALSRHRLPLPSSTGSRRLRPQILRRPGHVHVEGLGCMERPVGVAKHLPG